jgi:hypothetical protein
VFCITQRRLLATLNRERELPPNGFTSVRALDRDVSTEGVSPSVSLTKLIICNGYTVYLSEAQALKIAVPVPTSVARFSLIVPLLGVLLTQRRLATLNRERELPPNGFTSVRAEHFKTFKNHSTPWASSHHPHHDKFLTPPELRLYSMAESAYHEPNDGQAGTLVMTKQWWRVRYYVLAERGYRLRPRYHPQWGPFKRGKDFYTAEEGQATIVRVVAFLTFSYPYTPA